MLSNLLTKLLEQIAKEIGGKAASFLLDRRAKAEMSSFELYRALRNLEDLIAEAEKRLEHAFGKGWSEEKGDYEVLNNRLFDYNFVLSLSRELDRAQASFDQIDADIEIYSSREDMERLRMLLGADAEVMYLIHDNYNMSNDSIDQWKELIQHTKEAAKQAREAIAKFISGQFPM